MPSLRLLLLISTAAICGAPAYGQLNVDLKISRRTYLRHEPILATVSVSNYAGRDLELRDGEAQWFGFQISSGGADNIVPPRNPNYTLEPFEIKAGATVKRTVNLSSLYPLAELASYRIQATIFSVDLNKFFSSRPSTVNITEGRVIWQQTVGAPSSIGDGGGMRKVSLLSHYGAERRLLYVRVEDVEKGVVYCTYQLGHLIEGVHPEMQFDSANNLYVLQLAGPKVYRLSKIGLNGEFLGHATYQATKSRPQLRRLGDGTLQIVGGRREITPTRDQAEAATTVRLSDRPAGLPQ